MAKDKKALLRQLVPKSYHFDGYNELNCPNSRDKPLFSDNTIPMGEWFVTTRLQSSQILHIEFSSVCPCGKIIFEPYVLSLDELAHKLKTAVNTGCDFITFDIKVAYYHSREYCKNCASKNPDCTQLRKNNPDKFMAAVSFHLGDIKAALAHYYEINNKNSTGGLTMRPNKKLFGMNFEIGLSKDPNISSTMMGVAVRNPANGNWYVFDPATSTRKNMANMKFGDFPVVLLPDANLVVGDLVKIDNKYHYVKSINAATKTIHLIGAADGEIREIYPEESFIPGMTMYTKVMAFDAKTLTNPASKEGVGSKILAAVCMMQWAKGGNSSEFSLDNINDDSFNGLGAFLPMLMMSKDGNLGSMFTNPDGTPNMMMLFALGNGNGNSDQDGLMQMMILSNLMGSSSPFAGLTPAAAPAAPEAAPADSVVCDKCGTVFSDPDVAFCTKCGGKTHKLVLVTTCSKCGAHLKDGAVFCHACGTKVQPAVCPSCGKPYDAGDAFCSGCGSPLLVPAGDLPGTDEKTETPAPATT